MDSKLLVAAIDFGTTFSGYAYSMRHDFQKEALKITTNNWVCGGQGFISLKTPTTILLDSNQQFKAFGYEAEDKYSNLVEDDDHHAWYYFRRFKMLLHNNPDLSRSTMLPDVDGKELPARTVFTMGIWYLKDHLKQDLEKRIGTVLDEDIMWVLTVPSIWTDPAKQFMRECALDAGIADESLMLALEPEAASLYCQKLPSELLDCGSGRTPTKFTPGSVYMVLDLGGGTVDVTVHEVLPDGLLQEVQPASGGAWGGTVVDSNFFQFLVKLFGNEVLMDLKRENMSDYLEIMRAIELKKRTITLTGSDKITLRLPDKLFNLFERRVGQPFSEVLPYTNFATRLNLRTDKLRIEADVFREFFAESIENIVEHVHELLTNVEINAIIMVGGYAESSLIVHSIRERIPDTRIIVPSEPGLAVLKGAVLFGHQPDTIISRVSKFTYGVEVREIFDHNKHSALYVQEEGGIQYCRNVFDKFVRVGEDVGSKEVLEKYYTPNKEDAVSGVGVYASTSPSPMYITDASCSKLGTIFLEEPLDGWTKRSRVLVKFQFGGTEFHVHITDYDTGQTYSGRYNFLK